jgi:large subunit ribosomal protein L3
MEKADLKVGDEIKADVFAEGDVVKVTGLTIGRGFTGVVKRHGFKGGPKTHGQKHSLRRPGSIGATFPERVPKGKRMAGRYGGERVTVRNLKIAKVDAENNVIAIKGAVPGKRGTLLEIQSI